MHESVLVEFIDDGADGFGRGRIIAALRMRSLCVVIIALMIPHSSTSDKVSGMHKAWHHD